MTPQKQIKVFLYSRVSTNRQDVEVQLAQLRAVARQRHWLVIEEFADIGQSGAKTSRPSLDLMMQAVRRGQVNLVAAQSLDRLGRSVQHLINLVEELCALDVDLYLYREGLDTSVPLGKMLFIIAGSFAEFERSILKERIAAGLDRARAKGKRLGRPPKNHIDLDEARRLLAKGMSKKAIAKKLQVPRTSLVRALSGGDQNRL